MRRRGRVAYVSNGMNLALFFESSRVPPMKLVRLYNKTKAVRENELNRG